MKRIVGIITITLLLIMPLLLAVPEPVIAQPQEALSDAVGGGTGGTFWLDPNILYTGGVTITGDTKIYGQGAMIDLQVESIDVVGTYLCIERCTITNGTGIYGALEFLDGASGFVYDNIIVWNYIAGIYIEDSSDIVIKENSIIQNVCWGIYFEESTDITILENTINHNDIHGIYGDNGDLYDEDPNSQHNIRIKGNKIGNNFASGVELYWVNDVSIASNLIYANYVWGIYLDHCPIVSMTYNKIISNLATGIYYVGDPAWPDVTTSTGDHTVLLSLTMSYNKVMENRGYAVYVEFTQNVVITYNEIVGNPYSYGIWLMGTDLNFVEPVLIAYNTISGNFYGIYIPYGVSDVKILFNNIVGNYMYGIWVFGGEDSEDLLIKGNVVKETMSEFAFWIDSFDAPVVIEWNTILNNMFGLWLTNCESPQITHNTIMYSFETPANYLATCDGARIAYNTISYNEINNLYLSDSDDVIIEYNTIIGSQNQGIYAGSCEDMTIQHNVVYDNGMKGIEWFECSGLIANNMIGYSGSLSGNEYGIYLDDCLSPTTISDNTITGNLYGIYCAGSDPTIIGNYIANNVWGIWLDSGDGPGSNPTIGGTFDNRNYIIRNYQDGIYISDSLSNPTINYNNIYDNIGYGINNFADSNDVDAENNYWGEISGPGNPLTFGVGPGSGDEITKSITYSPWLVSIIP